MRRRFTVPAASSRVAVDGPAAATLVVAGVRVLACGRHGERGA
ncbi:MAG: hypothetical protein R2826_06225 [Thermoleophilia bacterium]